MNSLLVRVITGVVLIVVMFSLIYNPGPYMSYLLAAVLFFVTVGVYEYFHMVLPAKKFSHVPFLISLAASLAVVVWCYSFSIERYAITHFQAPSSFALDFIHGFPATGLVLFFIVFLTLMTLLVYLLVTEKIEEAPQVISLSILPLFYIAIPISMLLLLRAEQSGYVFLWWLAVMTSTTDIMGYVFGKTIGNHKMGWKLSPNKTWEGYIGGLAGQLVLSFVVYYILRFYFEIPDISFVVLFMTALAIYFLAVIGDLSESLIKRSVGVKDSGKIVPGHGGVLDRIDSYLTTLPGFYLALKLFIL